MEEESDNKAVARVDSGIRAAIAEAEAAEAAREAEEKNAKDEGRRIAYELLFVNGLYTSTTVEGPTGEEVESCLKYGHFAFDAYCTTCKRETTFRVASREVPNRGTTLRHGVGTVPPSLLAVNAVCQRDYSVYSYIMRFDNGKVTKVGQFPSMADLAFGELRTIDRSLKDVDRQELGKALGLHAHDTAIGAFVYLRRVFERMVQRAHDRQATAGNAVEGFDRMRMEDRIAALRDELPERVVQNSAIFSVLSLGIHELTEEQCNQYFAVLKAVLFQMLEQEEHKRKSELTANETETALRRILTDLGGSGEADDAGVVTERP